jgi:cytochrome c oxidase subunit 2
MKIKNLKYLVIGFLSGIIFSAGSALSNEPLPWQMGLQPAAGSISVMATDLHNLLLVVITAISLFVLFLMIYVCVRFRADRNPNPSKRTHNSILEVMWTVIPVLILVVIAVPSFRLLYYLDKQIEPDMTIKVTGIQWYWNYEYPDQNVTFDSYMISEEDLKPGQKRLLDVDNPLVLPEGSKVKVLIAGNDVMHSFFVPSLAVQEYSVPGRLNEVWMDIPNGEKTYYGQCNQICGINHAYMPVVVKVLTKENYDSWLKNAKIEFASVGELSYENIVLAEVKN